YPISRKLFSGSYDAPRTFEDENVLYSPPCRKSPCPVAFCGSPMGCFAGDDASRSLTAFAAAPTLSSPIGWGGPCGPARAEGEREPKAPAILPPMLLMPPMMSPNPATLLLK